MRILWLFMLMLATIPAAAADDTPWVELEPGLELGTFPLGKKYPLSVLRIDTERYELVLMNTSHPGQGKLHTAAEWCRRNGLVAGINASMYQTDYRRSVSLMRNGAHVNNSYVSKDKTVLAFGRRDADVPRAQIIDRTCQDFPALAERYETVVQSIRMVSCHGNNVWSQQKRRYSTAAIGADQSGRILFIHSRSPFSTHDFIDVLLGLDLDLRNAMYVEGGPEAQLYVGAGGQEREFMGSFETGFMESDLNSKAWPIPNLVGVRPRVDGTAAAE